MKNTSDVAKLMQQIENEYTAAQHALHSPAMVAKHAFITARMEEMQKAHAALQTILGPEEAIKLVAETLEALPEVRTEHVETLRVS